MIAENQIRDRSWRAAWIVPLILALGPQSARAWQPAGDDWIGKRVVQRHNNFPLRVDGQAVLRSGMEIHIYRVERRDGDKLWLEGDDDGPRGWAAIDQFVRLEDALPYLAERIRVHPDEVFYRALRAAVLSDRNELKEAIDDWNRIVELEPEDPASYIGRAKLWLVWVEWDKAIDDFTRAIKIDPDDPYSHIERARAYIAKQDYARAIVDCDRAISLDPQVAEFYYNRAWAWQKKGDKGRALADYAAGVALEAPAKQPDAAPAETADEKKTVDQLLLNLPLQRAPEEDVAKAPASRDRDRDIVPTSFDPLPAPAGSDRLPTAGKDAKQRAANASARATLDRDSFGIAEPQTGLEFAARAGDWLRAKLYDKAIADCDQAISLGCRDARARVYRGLAWREKHEYDKAIADYDEAIRLDAQNDFAYIARSSARSAKHEYDKAEADLVTAARIAPDTPVTHNARAWMWATCPDAHYRDGRKSVEAATRACELTDWDEGGIIDTLAAAYAEIGDFASAVKWQTKAIELETDAKDKAEFISRLEQYQQKKPFRDTKP